MESTYFSVTIVLLLGTLNPGSVEGANVTGVRWGGKTGDRSGVLEIQVDGTTWGVVCDDGWTENANSPNAIVACRALGFSNGGKAVLDGSYGDGIGDFLMDDAACSVDMTMLVQCQSAQGKGDCKRPGDTSVALECNKVSGPDVTTFQPPITTIPPSGVISDNCQSSQARTVQLIGNTNADGIKGTGYVKVKNPNTNQWGFVCDDGWNSMAAKVVCAQLCFPTNYTAKPGIPAELKVDIGDNPTIILDDVRCTGNEATLEDCPSNDFDSNTNNCDIKRGEIAGVQCVEAEFESPNPPDPELVCGGGVLRANFYRSRDVNLDEKHLTVLNDANCADVSTEKTTRFVSIIIPVDKCGTSVSRNGTHILYNNEIKYASTFEDGVITRFNTYRVGIECAMPVDRVVTQRVQAVTQAVTENADGVIVAGMEIYRSDSFSTPVTENPVRIPLGEYLNLAINMEDYDPRLKLVVENCVATPTGDTSNSILTKELFKDKCIAEKTLSTYPISNSEFGFRFKPFKFVDYPLLYIQCDSIICLTADVTNECDRTCNNTKPTPASSNSGRRKRSATVQKKSTTSPAIFIYDPHEPEPDSGKDDIKIVITENDANNRVDDAATPTPRQQQLQTTAERNPPQTPKALTTSSSSPLGDQKQTPPAISDIGKTDSVVTNENNKENIAKNTDNDDEGNDLSQKDTSLSLNDNNSACCLSSFSSLFFFLFLVVSMNVHL